MTEYPEVTVGALIRNDRDELFLMKSYKWKNRFCIPGGHIEMGETAREAVIREVKEETSLDITDVEFLCVQESVYSDLFFEKRHFIFLDFTCRAVSKEVILNEEASEYAWVRPADLQNYDIEPFTRKAIELYLNPAPERYVTN